MKGVAIASFLPLEFIPVLLAGAGLALILGARRLAGGLVILVLVSILLPPFLEPLLVELPLWALLLIGLGLGLALVREVLSLIIGRRATDNAVGTLIANLLTALILFPRFVIRALMRWFV